MIWVYGNEITHAVLRKVLYRDGCIILDFYDIKELDSDKGIIRYTEDGTIGGGVE